MQRKFGGAIADASTVNYCKFAAENVHYWLLNYFNDLDVDDYLLTKRCVRSSWSERRRRRRRHWLQRRRANVVVVVERTSSSERRRRRRANVVDVDLKRCVRTNVSASFRSVHISLHPRRRHLPVAMLFLGNLGNPVFGDKEGDFLSVGQGRCLSDKEGVCRTTLSLVTRKVTTVLVTWECPEKGIMGEY